MTDISALEGYAGLLSEAAAEAKTASAKQKHYVEGGALEDVDTESGPVPTLAKQARLADEKIDAALIDVASQMAGAMTYGTVEKGLLGTSNAGFFSVPSALESEYLVMYRNDAGVATAVKRYPSSEAVDSVLGLIAPSAGAPPVAASVVDEDGFEIVQFQEDKLKANAYELGEHGFKAAEFSVQHVNQFGIPAGLSIMDPDGFHYELEPGGSTAAKDTHKSVLASLRHSLASELQDVCIRLVGDSITWGMTVGGGGVIDPRNHALADVRNNLTSPSWANLLHQYLGGRYSTGVLSNPAPGVALYQAAHAIDIAGSTEISVVDVAAGSNVAKVVEANAAAALGALCVVSSGRAVAFDTVGSAFSVVYVETPSSGSFDVVVDGQVVKTVVATGSTTTYGKVTDIAVSFGKHSVELRCSGSVSFEHIKKTRKIRIANDGLIGTNTVEWLPGGSLLPASVASDDTHVFVQLGTNDRGRTAVPNDPVRTKRNLEAIADYLVNVLGKQLVLMAANFATIDYPSDATYKYSQADVSRMIAQVVGKFSCGHVDNYHATLKQKLAGENFLSDGLHPNDTGHMQMFKNIVDSLERA
ncbi:SGNH/GDSL hydrolase family protein [Pseudomonas sp. CIP-10]|uniref:SGNH/GDSL hydrolase family protein n=1 Tax=Pseudomonas sp. CIP-10 TaxID=2892442 RepID=UPI001E495DCA|nr:SGNH/GDSL hydrolase family protein [Pseudomonas sp. CIP-10]UFH28836.1 SGNH/GDSL hydrolase family protein [Pseudomonas sp. CIP-10]